MEMQNFDQASLTTLAAISLESERAAAQRKGSVKAETTIVVLSTA
jgi:hypothetical protein